MIKDKFIIVKRQKSFHPGDTKLIIVDSVEELIEGDIFQPVEFGNAGRILKAISDPFPIKTKGASGFSIKANTYNMQGLI